MTCCCVDTINNRRLFSLIKEQRRAKEKITGGGGGQFFLMSWDLPILRRDRLGGRRDRLVDRDRRIEHPWSKVCGCLGDVTSQYLLLCMESY